MIDVGKKEKTQRIAKAQAFIHLNKEIIKRIKKNNIPKGNVLEIARVAGILAAKKTDSLIPLCHNIELDYVDINFKIKPTGLLIESRVKSRAKTGVEMEAIVACSMAAVTVYDMCKMFSKTIKISDIELLEKRGGKSGDYQKK
ncbi:MAG: cyclic pyranopterin monophosphate synthase MoaC [Candidatus Omnitrophota bacterium]|nr:MAG: cyclic pyranopterin monophosphate synthase MoaC [Candidatus Omnitrophota bacterium]